MAMEYSVIHVAFYLDLSLCQLVYSKQHMYSIIYKVLLVILESNVIVIGVCKGSAC
jgi:hypothetical protein